MIVCGLDLETTGLDVVTDDIIELGLVLWDTNRKAPIKIYNEIIYSEKVSPEIEKITGITQKDCKLYGIEFNGYAYEVLHQFFNEADYIVAHNGNMFDKPILDNHILRYNLSLPQKPWLDTSLDIPFPEEIKTRNLKHLGAEHDFLNPFSHRAVFDVLSMLKILSKYDINAVIDRYNQPNVIVIASTEKPWIDGGASTNEAKANGFRWNASDKVWSKTIKENELEFEKKRSKSYLVTRKE